ncbi:MAG: type II secretion system protein GspG [Nitrospirota bacterium]|nr:type II secretion system protein GspG [Nitrospirota bacterium]
MKLREQKGFTLIEVIVVAGIIAILAGILVPLIFKEIDESKISRASADVKSISTAMLVFKKDTGQWPITSTCAATTTMLMGAGTLPTLTGAGWNSGVVDVFENYLSQDDNGCWPTTWKGPYMAFVNADPWGRSYIINADSLLTATSPIWLLSAGPDGIIDTATTNSTPVGDDIGTRLR